MGPPPPQKKVGFWGSGDGDGSLRVPPFWDRMLRKDKEEAEAIKNAKALEEEKAMYSVSSCPPYDPPPPNPHAEFWGPGTAEMGVL